MTRSDGANPDLIALGVLRKAIGLDGACAFQAFGSTLRRLGVPAPVFVGSDESACHAMTLERVEFRPKGPVCFLSGVCDAETAELLRGRNMYLERSLLPPLEENAYYQFELVGMKVQTDKGQEIGTVERVENFPTVDSILVRRCDGESVVLPLTGEALVTLDRTTGYITVRQAFIEELL